MLALWGRYKQRTRGPKKPSKFTDLITSHVSILTKKILCIMIKDTYILHKQMYLPYCAGVAKFMLCEAAIQQMTGLPDALSLSIL